MEWQHCKAGERLKFLPLLLVTECLIMGSNNRKEDMVRGLTSEFMNVNETNNEDILKQICQRIPEKRLVVPQQGG